MNTNSPSSMAATARPMHRVDFPVPPFWLAKVMARINFRLLTRQVKTTPNHWEYNNAAREDVLAGISLWLNLRFLICGIPQNVSTTARFMANPNGFYRCSCSDRSAAELLCGRGPHDEERRGVPDETAALKTARLLRRLACATLLFRTAQVFGRLFFL